MRALSQVDIFILMRHFLRERFGTGMIAGVAPPEASPKPLPIGSVRVPWTARFRRTLSLSNADAGC